MPTRLSGIRRAAAWTACALSFLIVLPPHSGSAAVDTLPPDSTDARPRAREAGVVVGLFPPGPLNAITDVAGVQVGHATVIEGDAVRTGVTAIVPHDGNLYRERVPAAIYVGNGFGKLLGVTQVHELGELETPLLLTCTLCVWQAADALVDTLLARPDMADVRSINPVVGETNDGYLNDIRARPIRPEHVRAALRAASDGPVEEGAVGAGTGTVAFGWKGGIGTSSRRLPDPLGGHTVGVLVQANFGGVLTINGAPVGRELGQYAFQRALGQHADGSIMIVVATDAPLTARTLRRLAKRSLVGLARTGASMTNGSGDYVIAFSTMPTDAPGPRLANDALSPLFQAVAEATEEAIYNALFQATTMDGHRGTVEALPMEATLDVLRRYDVLRWDETLPPNRD
ncbi:MAG: S58 family peptidase [Bacteroidetes bacterium]|jgi:D-aminopeptidase|nr:S58 family peptidase [Bacteroidota bacterium]